MPEHGKRKKFHDKDKYYHLAKEQGYRSRAAFKLTQINRKFPCLENCQTAVLDLCAAPGGWTQVAARTCPKSVQIVAVDILPIRSFKGFPNIATIVGDITTDKAKSDIKHAVAGKPVDLVLHDGAPNVGADYSKDAYEQNEISLHALRCATQHLVRGGTFVTKIYRSRDYASYHWLLQQLFHDVSVFKPKASRQQSAEIFLVAQKYKAPAKIDPRMLDPKHIFEAVEGNTTGGGDRENKAVSIFHKNFDKPKRQRGGYDMEFFDATMRHLTPVKEFVSVGFKEAVQILGQSTSLEFEEKDPTSSFLLHHPLTTNEIQTNLSDLQVLSKSDFKTLLGWRVKMRDALSARKEDEDDEESDADSAVASDDKGDDSDDVGSDEEEEQIQSEISEMRQRRQREKKRKVKKERAVAAKRRRKAALGMDISAIEVPDNEKLFSLATITTKGDLAAAAEVNLDEVTDEQIFGDGEDDVVVGKPEEHTNDQAERLLRRERDLDEAYELYLQSTKNGDAKSGTKMAKRSKKIQRMKVMEEAVEDQEMLLADKGGINYDTMAYAKMLRGDNGSDDEADSSDSDESDDGFHADPVTPEVHAAMKLRKEEDAKNSNPLIHKIDEEPSSVKAARWFSNPLFESIQKTVQSATKQSNDADASSDDEVDSDNSDVEEISESNQEAQKGSQATKQRKSKMGLDAADVLASMPKTDKQKRHEKRLKQIARDERKQARRTKKLDDEEGDFELAPATEESDSEDEQLKNLSESKKKQVLEAREQIKAGMGKALDDKPDKDEGFEVVGQDMERPMPVKDTRKYDSDHEDYDSDDYAETLALGTMMLRKSKEKALVDASYNRYAWNDPGDLPEWFLDDEKKHYRPQLPLPPALVAKMKERMMALAAKPIKKVAEARARKNKLAKSKLAAAKQKAEAVANSSEMNDAMKLKAISKALRGQENKKPGKTYVVATKGRGGAQGKGVKLVDKRMKSDKRAMNRIEKKRKKGKQNGLVGSKKRRHHK
mmetsp:Transcript_26932/g.61952  ORF Transcript_26932/g.61952 Transcript_26932/m.61952 type:complete len:1000 (+) Transcript_26932:137-3136(+)